MKITSDKLFSLFTLSVLLCIGHELCGMAPKITFLEQPQRNCVKKDRSDECCKIVIEDESETERKRIYGVRPPTPYPKDRSLSPEVNDDIVDVSSKNDAVRLYSEQLQAMQLLRVIQTQKFAKASLKMPTHDVVCGEELKHKKNESTVS